MNNITLGENMSNAEKVQEMVNELPKTQSMVIELRHLQNWSYENIAECLNMTDARVQQIERSALRRLAHFSR